MTVQQLYFFSRFRKISSLNFKALLKRQVAVHSKGETWLKCIGLEWDPRANEDHFQWVRLYFESLSCGGETSSARSAPVGSIFPLDSKPLIKLDGSIPDRHTWTYRAKHRTASHSITNTTHTNRSVSQLAHIWVTEKKEKHLTFFRLASTSKMWGFFTFTWWKLFCGGENATEFFLISKWKRLRQE